MVPMSTPACSLISVAWCSCVPLLVRASFTGPAFTEESVVWYANSVGAPAVAVTDSTWVSPPVVVVVAGAPDVCGGALLEPLPEGVLLSDPQAASSAATMASGTRKRAGRLMAACSSARRTGRRTLRRRLRGGFLDRWAIEDRQEDDCREKAPACRDEQARPAVEVLGDAELVVEGPLPRPDHGHRHREDHENRDVLPAFLDDEEPVEPVDRPHGDEEAPHEPGRAQRCEQTE